MTPASRQPEQRQRPAFSASVDISDVGRCFISASMPWRCSQSSPMASCRKSFRAEPTGSLLARRSASAACFSNADNWRPTCCSRPGRFRCCDFDAVPARARLSHFSRRFCEAVHSCRLPVHNITNAEPPSGVAYCLDLSLIRLNRLAVAINAAMPTKLTTICIASPSEMLYSARWPANASRTPRQ